MKKAITLSVLGAFLLGFLTLACGPSKKLLDEYYDAKMQKQEAEDRMAKAKSANAAYKAEYDKAVKTVGELKAKHKELHDKRNAIEKARKMEITPELHGHDKEPTWE
jgi:predicted nuclease with TOPRIM domain